MAAPRRAVLAVFPAMWLVLSLVLSLALSLAPGVCAHAATPGGAASGTPADAAPPVPPAPPAPVIELGSFAPADGGAGGEELEEDLRAALRRALEEAGLHTRDAAVLVTEEPLTEEPLTPLSPLSEDTLPQFLPRAKALEKPAEPEKAQEQAAKEAAPAPDPAYSLMQENAAHEEGLAGTPAVAPPEEPDAGTPVSKPVLRVYRLSGSISSLVRDEPRSASVGGGTRTSYTTVLKLSFTLHSAAGAADGTDTLHGTALGVRKAMASTPPTEAQSQDHLRQAVDAAARDLVRQVTACVAAPE